MAYNSVLFNLYVNKNVANKIKVLCCEWMQLD